MSKESEIQKKLEGERAAFESQLAALNLPRAQKASKELEYRRTLESHRQTYERTLESAPGQNLLVFFYLATIVVLAGAGAILRRQEKRRLTTPRRPSPPSHPEMTQEMRWATDSPRALELSSRIRQLEGLIEGATADEAMRSLREEKKKRETELAYLLLEPKARIKGS